jgi:Transposase IS4
MSQWTNVSLVYWQVPDIVNIPTKPTPIGHKIWVLSDSGYVLDSLWHVRGNNKGQGLKPRWNAIKTSTGKRQFPPTQQVVLELISKIPNEQTLLSINQSIHPIQIA